MNYDVNKVINIALAEEGYVEKASKMKLYEKVANAGKANFTKYWEDLSPGMQGQPYCNAFINWVFTEAYGEHAAKSLLCTPGAWSYYTPTSSGYFKNKKQWYTSNPQVGDIIYFKNSQRICHVGLVTKVDDHKVYTIEGNTSGNAGVVANGGGVFQKSYMLTYNRIAGYGRPKYIQETDNTFYPKYQGISTSSLDTILTSIGVESKYIGSKIKRQPLAQANNISAYEGTYLQNMKLISLAKEGKLRKVY